MGWFSNDPKTVKLDQLDDILEDIPSLDRVEREYVKGVFTRFRYGNISKSDVEKAIQEIRRDTSDVIDPAEAEAIRKKLRELL